MKLTRANKVGRREQVLDFTRHHGACADIQNLGEKKKCRYFKILLARYDYK